MTLDRTPLIRGYHAHVYFDDASRDRAEELRGAVGRMFKVGLGPWRAAPIGPHLSSQYHIMFDDDEFSVVVPFLMMNRMGLSILVHPESGRPREDHTSHAMWLGDALPVDIGFLEAPGEPSAAAG